jgi:thiaminase (transcriptional activator TenA)
MSLSNKLWQASADLAQVALEHRFVRGLADGTLPRTAFQQYVAQDAFFLETFARAYALALARSPDRHVLGEFYDLLSGVQQELRLHQGYAARWGIDLERVAPVPATSNYTDFLLATASLEDVGATCAAMAPCMRLYAYLGHSLAAEMAEVETVPERPEHNPYADWVQTYADPAFEDLARTLERLLDRYAADTSVVRAKYRRAMELEVAFFEASATASEPPVDGGRRTAVERSGATSYSRRRRVQ